MLLDLLGAANPRITSTYGHGTTDLFQELPAIGEQPVGRGLYTSVQF